MKIAYISSSTIPSRAANSIHVMKMCQAFAQNGHEVVLVAPHKRDSLEPGVEDVYKFYGVDECFEIIKLPWLLVKGRGHIYGLLAGLKARSLKPDLVFCRNTPGCFFAAKLGLPVILESHSPAEDSGLISEWMFRGILNSSRLQKLVVITHALKKYYQENYPVDRVQIQVAPDAADPIPEGTPPFVLPNKGERLQVGYVGHLYQGRGVEIIMEIAKLCNWADFHLVGGNDADISYWKIQTQIHKNICFHGFVAPAEAERLRISFDVLLAPYQQKVTTTSGGNNVDWMSPLKLFEYMATGKAIICSDLPVLREVVEHEKNVLLCPPDDGSAWQNALERLQHDPALREKLGNSGYNEFVQHFTWKVRAYRVGNTL
jgi:glycosyltransferase involved in cell wall biosynthesis